MVSHAVAVVNILCILCNIYNDRAACFCQKLDVSLTVACLRWLWLLSGVPTSWTLTVELHMEMLLHVNKGKTALILLFSYVFELCMRRNLAVALRDESRRAFHCSLISTITRNENCSVVLCMCGIFCLYHVFELCLVWLLYCLHTLKSIYVKSSRVFFELHNILTLNIEFSLFENLGNLVLLNICV